MQGYSLNIYNANKAADQNLLGVQLGEVCIRMGIPAKDVAKKLQVSRAVVYLWFSGSNEVSKHLRDRVETYYRSLPGTGPYTPSHAT